MPVTLTGQTPSTSSTSSGSGVGVGQIFLQLSLQNNIAGQISQQSNQAAQTASSAFSRVGQIAGAALKAFSVAAIVKFGQECINVASDLTEVQNVVDTAFGDMAYQCEEFAKTASSQFGISELSAKKMASTFMSMSTGMGLSGDQAAKMSINVAKLSADVASFYNLSVDAASTKLKAIWTGETEGLKDLGVVMTQTNLQAYAMSKGITTNIADMNQAEQTTLRYNYVMEQLRLAQGDFAKTSGSWSNSVKSMGESFRSAMGNIGQILIDVFTPALQIISDLISKLAQLTEKASEAYFNLFRKESTDEAVKNVSSAGEQMAGAIEETNQEIQDSAMGLAGFDELYTIGSKEESASNSAVAAFGEIEDYKSAEVERESILDKFFTKIKDVYEKIKPVLSGIYEEFVQPVVGAVSFCIEYIKTKFEPIKEIFSSYFGSLGTIASTYFGYVANVFSDMWDSLGKFWNSYGKEIFTGIVDGVVNFAAVVEKYVRQIIVPVFQIFIDTLQKFWDEHGKKLFDGILQLIGELGTFITNLWNNILMPLFSWMIDVFGPFVTGVWQTICDFIGFTIGNISDGLYIIINFFTSIFYSLNDLIENGIVQTFKDFVTNIGEIFSNLWEIIKTPINWIIEGVNKVIGALNSLSIDVPDWVPGIGGQTWGFNIPEIPMLANGGIIDQPTIAMVGEGNSSEAVIPLDGRLEEIIAKAVASTMAALGISREPEEQTITIPLTVNLGSKTIINEVVSSINRQTRVNGRSVIINK